MLDVCSLEKYFNVFSPWIPSHLDIRVALVSWSIHVRQILQENDHCPSDDAQTSKASGTSQKSICDKRLPSKRQPWRWQLRSLEASLRTWWRRAPLAPSHNISGQRDMVEMSLWKKMCAAQCVGDCWQPTLLSGSASNTQIALYKHQLAHGPPPFRLPLIGLPPTGLPPTGLPPFILNNESHYGRVLFSTVKCCWP